MILSAARGIADQPEAEPLKIGTCDWSIQMPMSRDSFEFAQRNGLSGIQYSFDWRGRALICGCENRDTIRATIKKQASASHPWPSDV